MQAQMIVPPEQRKVGAVIPVRNSGAHVNELLESIFAQRHDNYKAYLSMEEGDKTHESIAEHLINDPRLVLVWSEKIEGWTGRNSNRLRNAGVRAALKDGADVVILTDVKIRHKPSFIEDFLSVMARTGAKVVGGMMVTPPGSKMTFLKMFTDRALMTRNPRPRTGYFITAENMAYTESLPITACLAVEREVFESGVWFNEDARDSYEDYFFDQEVVDADFSVYFTPEIVVYHEHRTSFKAIRLEYKRSARGAAQMMTTYPWSGFARRRLVQSMVVATGLLVSVLLLLIIVVAGIWEMLAGLSVVGGMGFVSLGLTNAYTARHWWGFFFPPLTAFFIIIFTLSYWRKMIEGGGVSKDNSFLQTMWSYWFTWVVR